MRLKCVVPKREELNYEFQCTAVIKQEMFIIPKVKKQVTKTIIMINITTTTSNNNDKYYHYY